MTNETDGIQEKLTFEDVDIETFTSNNTALRTIITKLFGNDPTMVSGLESLMAEKMLLRSFYRGIITLIKIITECSKKNKTYDAQLLEGLLKKVEAAFQTTINEIKTLNAQKSPYMNNKKTSLYLYTLQNLTMNLGSLKCLKSTSIHYIPTIKKKLQLAKIKSANLGIGDDIIRRECYSMDYQQPYDPALRNFEFLDESRLDSYINRLHRYEITRNPRDLYNFKIINQPKQNVQKTQAVETLIKHMEKKFQIKEMNLNYYKQNFHAINQELIKILGRNDLVIIYELIDSISQYLEAKQRYKEQISTSQNIDHIM